MFVVCVTRFGVLCYGSPIRLMLSYRRPSERSPRFIWADVVKESQSSLRLPRRLLYTPQLRTRAPLSSRVCAQDPALTGVDSVLTPLSSYVARGLRDPSTCSHSDSAFLFLGFKRNSDPRRENTCSWEVSYSEYKVKQNLASKEIM